MRAQAHYGAPFISSRCYREGNFAFTQALAERFCKIAYARPVRPRLHDGTAISVSWV